MPFSMCTLRLRRIFPRSRPRKPPAHQDDSPTPLPEDGGTNATQPGTGYVPEPSHGDVFLAGEGESSRDDTALIDPEQSTPNSDNAETGTQVRPKLWCAAVGRLEKNDKAWLNQTNIAPFNTSDANIVNDLINLVIERQNECQEKKWKKITLGSYDISFHEMAKSSIDWLAKFKEIGDTIVQYDPVHAALPWAAFRFILQAVILNQEQMAASFAIVDLTTRIFHRCQIFEELYNRDKQPLQVVEGLESALIKLYSLLLQGLVRVGQLLQRNTPHRSIHAIFNPDQLSDLLLEVQRSETEVEKEIRLCENHRSSTMDTKLEERLRKLLELEKPLRNVDKSVTDILSHIEHEELVKVLQWISNIPHNEHHQRISDSRTEDTCEWILSRPEYDIWRNTGSKMMLWLQGFPGTGKTFLTSRVIDNLKNTLSDDLGERYAFFYCNRTESERRNAVSVIRSYIRQLSTDIHLSGYICPQMKQLHEESILKGSGWTLELCKKHLIRLLDLYPQTTLILDALDECIDEERGILLELLDSLAIQSSNPVRIFISSRPESDIRQFLRHLPQINILASNNRSDISKYVNKKIGLHGRWSSALKRNPALKKEIIQTLLDKSDGMFQWAKLQIEQLLKLTLEQDLRDRLGKLPVDLEAAYDEVYDNIMSQGPNANDQVLRALKWVMCANEPLTTKQLLTAIQVDPERRVTQGPTITEEDLLGICANFLGLDSQRNPPVWRVSHLSVIEYLEEHRIKSTSAHCFVASASLTLLLEAYDPRQESDNEYSFKLESENENSLEQESDDESSLEQESDDENSLEQESDDENSLEQESDDESSLEEESDDESSLEEESDDENSLEPESDEHKHVLDSGHPLHFYVTLNWLYHTQVQEMSGFNSTLSSLLQTFLGSPGESSVQYRNWIAILPTYGYLRCFTDKVSVKAEELYPHTDAVLCICRFALYYLVDWWKSDFIDRTYVRSVVGGDLLATAARAGSKQICNYFINLGVDVNSQLDLKVGSALAASAIFASHKGNIEVMKFLIEQGADPNMSVKCGDYGSALAAAVTASGSYSGNIKAIEYLIKQGADPNMPLQCGTYGSALAAAAASGSYSGNIKAIEYLIKQGADPNMPLQCGEYGSALAAAAAASGSYSGNIKAIEYLIKQGADPNMPLQCGEYGSALAAAAAAASGSYSGNIKAIEYLIKQGADPNMPLQCGTYGSALAAAAAATGSSYSGNIKAIEYLIKQGANPNMPLQYGDYGSALAAAAAAAADDDNLYGGYLYGGNIKAIEYLIEQGVNPNMPLRYGKYGSALAAASAQGVIKVVEFLIEHGADQNMRLELVD